MPTPWTPPPGWDWRNELWLTPDQVAFVLKVSRDTVDEMCEKQLVPWIDLGEKRRHSYKIPTRGLLDALDALGAEHAKPSDVIVTPKLRSMKREA